MNADDKPGCRIRRGGEGAASRAAESSSALISALSSLSVYLAAAERLARSEPCDLARLRETLARAGRQLAAAADAHRNLEDDGAV